MAQSSRIEYIDSIKGFSILWVVVFHFGEIVPDWMTVGYRMPLFFFLSGIFFRARPWQPFIMRRVNTLLVPFFFFLLVAYLIAGLEYQFVDRIYWISKVGTGWDSILALSRFFTLNNPNPHEPVLLNEPLWFLIGLFNVQVIYRLICSITKNKMLIITIAFAFYVVARVLLAYNINGLLFIPLSFNFLIYYVLGSLYGAPLMNFIASRKNTIKVMCLCAVVMLGALLFDTTNPGNITEKISLNLQIAAFIPLVFIFFKSFHRFDHLKILQYFGQNSLVVLATQFMVSSIFRVLVTRILPIIGPYQSRTSIPYHIVMFAFICVVSYIMIKLCNRYIPQFVGKKDLIKYKRASS